LAFLLLKISKVDLGLVSYPGVLYRPRHAHYFLVVKLIYYFPVNSVRFIQRLVIIIHLSSFSRVREQAVNSFNPYLPLPTMSDHQRINIWLDCDTGHDDAFAMLLAAHHPSSNLLGISTVYGNASLENTTYNTRAILKAIGREDIPIYPGAAKPYCRETVHAPDIHGESGLDGTTCLPVPDVPVKTDKTAIAAMHEALIATPKGTSWVVATGATTNVALLFSVYPELVEHVAGLSIMGGAVGDNFTEAVFGALPGEEKRFGNITPYAEFNIYIDPESAKSMFINNALAAKTTLITLDLTHLFLGTEEIRQSLLHGFSAKRQDPSLVRKLFVEILSFHSKTYAEVFGITAGAPTHDVLAVAAAFAPALFGDGNRERFEVDIITDGAYIAHSGMMTVIESECGRTVAKSLSSGEIGVRVPRKVDANAVWSMIDECLAKAEKTS
jgi:uridine nucleosidase